MSRVAGDSGDVFTQAKDIRNIVKEILWRAKRGRMLLDELSATSRDKSHEIAEDVVSDVEEIMMKGMEHCAEVVEQLVEYSKFLMDLEQ